MTTNKRKVNVLKGRKGFQETEKAAPSSDANLGDTNTIERDPCEAFPQDQDFFEYQCVYRNALRVEFPDLDADLIDDQLMSNAYGNYYHAVNQLAREGKSITQTMLADLNEPNRRYIEHHYGELVESNEPPASFADMDATNPNIVHDLQARIDKLGLIREYDIAKVGKVHSGELTERQHLHLTTALTPAVTEFSKRLRIADRKAREGNADDFTRLIQAREDMKSFCEQYDEHSKTFDFNSVEVENRRLYYPLFLQKTAFDVGVEDAGEFVGSIDQTAASIRARRAARKA